MLPEHSSPFFSGHGGIFKRETGDLPHWTQTDKLQFITFRLGDSLPQSKIEELKRERKEFESINPQPWDSYTRRMCQNRLERLNSKFLDQGYGSCILRGYAVRKEVEDTILKGDDVDYRVLAFVIMPNHIHLLIYHFEKTIDEIVQAIKSISTRKINKLLGRKGSLWMTNYFDRLIRSQSHLVATIQYIENNPRGLPSNSYTLYINHEALSEFL